MAERRFSGGPPLTEGWAELAVIQEPKEGISWRLFIIDSGAGWVRLKACAEPSAPNKGNYMLAWHGQSQRFADNKDHRVISTHRPHLLSLIRHRLIGETLA